MPRNGLEAQSGKRKGREAKWESLKKSVGIGGIGTDRLGVGLQTLKKAGWYVGTLGYGEGKCTVDEQIWNWKWGQGEVADDVWSAGGVWVRTQAFKLGQGCANEADKWFEKPPKWPKHNYESWKKSHGSPI